MAAANSALVPKVKAEGEEDGQEADQHEEAAAGLGEEEEGAAGKEGGAKQGQEGGKSIKSSP